MNRSAEEIAASTPHVVYGREILGELAAQEGRYAVLTMPEPWAIAEPQLSQAVAIQMVESMDRDTVAQVEQGLPTVDTVIGLGGGSAVDMAKYVAWRRGIRLITAPSIVSVDAAVTNTVAVRDAGRVRYIGFVIPDRVAVDFAVIAAAPPRLNRAGIGDILSIHTGCWDWRVAGARPDAQGGAPYDAEIAAAALGLRDALERRAGQVRGLDDDALRFIMEAYVAENALCLHAGTSQPEEGSEHYWAYNLEYRTGRHFVHGELICLGVLLMARLQENEPERVRTVIERAGVRYQPADLGISGDELRASLLTLREYVTAERLPNSVIDERPLDEAAVDGLLAGLTVEAG